MKKTLAFILVLALALTLFVIPVSAEGPDETSGRIESYEMNDTQAFAYIPDGLEGGRRGAGRGNSTAVQQIAPIILVYGDAPFTAESALQTAYDSGLAAIAAKEGAVISFINPKNGATWSQDDVGTYSSIVQNKYVERPAQSLEPTDGIYPNETYGGQFAGFFYRTVIVAAGSGADFATKYLMDDTLVDSRNIQTIPAAYILFDATATPGDKAGSVNQEYPAVVVNGTQAVKSAIAALNNDSGYVMFEESSGQGFNSTLLTKGYKELAGLMVRPQMSYSPLPNHYIGLFQLTNNLVLDDLYDYGYTSKAVTGGTAYYDYYIPKSIDRSAAESVPLVMVFHGSGESSEYIAKMGGWTRLAHEEGFMVVSVDNHGSVAIQIALLDALLAEYPFLDASRVYATGFSMGSMKTWSLVATEEYAQKFAAISPWSGLSASLSYQTSVIVPTYYTHGHWDNTTRPPSTNTGARTALQWLFTANKVGDYTYDASVNEFWGVEGDTVETVAAQSWDGQINIHTFASEDGMVYTKLVDASNFGHGISGDFASMAWDFMKTFSRNSDGTVAIESSLALTVDKRLVSSGDYFSVTAALTPAANSNAATLSFEYDPNKFVYHKFDAVEGIAVLGTNNDTVNGVVTLTLGYMDGYGIDEVGAALFQARTDVKLINEKVTITGGMNYVLLKDGEKVIKSVGSSAQIGTVGMLGDTNNDGVIDLIDLSNMIDWFGVTSADAAWEQAEYFDFNYNDQIDISDISKVASMIHV